MGKMALIFVFILVSYFAHAENNVKTQDPYFQISEITVELLENSQGFNSDLSDKHNIQQDPESGSEIGDVISVMREIIAFGKEIYKIVEAGKPVINTKYAAISVLPLDTEFGRDINPTDLSDWKAPKFAKFKVSYKNGYGVEVVSFTYNINMSPGGKYQGKGSYITNAQIVPENISVAWGYTFNSTMSLVGLTNIGSEEDPVAGATLQLSYSVSTVVKEIRSKMTIFIAGDGTIQQL